MSVKDGGPAFPFAAETNEGPVTYPGMTLRDWFAGMALQGVFYAGSDIKKSLGRLACEEDMAAIAYSIADAMLKERGE